MFLHVYRKPLRQVNRNVRCIMKIKMQKTTDLLNEAIEIAKKVLSGDIDPNKGCSMIGDINHALNWPMELSAFGMLAHEQYDHESIGITAEGCVPEILDECRKLIALSANK